MNEELLNRFAAIRAEVRAAVEAEFGGEVEVWTDEYGDFDVCVDGGSVRGLDYREVVKWAWAFDILIGSAYGP